MPPAPLDPPPPPYLVSRNATSLIGDTTPLDCVIEGINWVACPRLPLLTECRQPLHSSLTRLLHSRYLRSILIFF